MSAQDEMVSPIMRELRMGNIIAVERGRGMLVIDPSLFAVGQSPSVALVANMSDEEMDRVLFLDAGDPECSFGVNPFASLPMDDSEESVTRRSDMVRALRDMLMPFLDMDASDESLVALMGNMLTLMACMPGSTLTDIPVLAESVLAREVGLSFVPYEQDESCFPEKFMKFHPDSFDQMMRHGASLLANRTRRFMTTRMTLRHIVGQSSPGNISECLRQQDIVVARIPNDGWEGPFCQEMLLRFSGLMGDAGTKWISMSTNEVFSSNPSDSDEMFELAMTLSSHARERGMVADRDAIERQIVTRTGLLEGGDRNGWLRFCNGLGL